MKTLIAVTMLSVASFSAMATCNPVETHALESAQPTKQKIFSEESLRKSIRSSAMAQLHFGKQQLAMQLRESEDKAKTEVALRAKSGRNKVAL